MTSLPPTVEIRIGFLVGLLTAPGSSNVMTNVSLVDTIEDFPAPNAGDMIQGCDSQGNKYFAKVLWLLHDYERRVINVYACYQ